MTKYRFKTKKEFIRDGLWDEKYNCPDEWEWEGQMNEYLGIDIPEEFNTDCDKNNGFEYDDWVFSENDYVLKEQQYFHDLSQHIGRYIKALVDNPHLGSRVKKGDIGKIISSTRADFPNYKSYSCSNALTETHLGTKYELLPEDYSPEQETIPEKKEPNIEFIPGKWYKLTDCENAYRKCSQIPVENRLPYSELIEKSGYRCETGSSEDLTRIKLVKDLSEIQEYLLDGHPDKIINQKFEIGKWYKWYQKNHTSYHYGKVKEINLKTDILVMSPWIIQCDEYMYSGTFDLSKAEQIQEISIEDIQEFLPNGHSDKIYKSSSDEVECTEFKKGEYIVITDKFDSWSKDFISNHIYKQRKDSTYLQPEYDSSDSITNGWVKYTRNNSHNWRYATQEEIDEYERRGKPYDVTESQKKELSMEKIQEECKKRFPIGCTFINTSGNKYILKEDHITYHIFSNMICTHSCGGYLYENGKYAELISLPKENVTEIPEYAECIDYFGSQYTGKIYNTTIDKPEKISTNTWYGILINCGRLKDGSFKISNKEAYEKQKSQLKDSEELTTKIIMGNDPCKGTTSSIFTHDEIKQFPSISSDYWKNVPTFVEKEFDIYGPTPDIE